MQGQGESPGEPPEPSDGIERGNSPNAAVASSRIEPALVPLVQTLEEVGVPSQAQETIIQGIRAAISLHSGPLPAPLTLREYDDVVPGLARDFVEAWKGETAHRQKLEEFIVRENASLARDSMKIQARGQIYAGGLAVFFGIAALWLGLTGHEWLGGAAITTTISSVLVTYLARRKFAKNEDETEEANERTDKPESGIGDS